MKKSLTLFLLLFVLSAALPSLAQSVYTLTPYKWYYVDESNGSKKEGNLKLLKPGEITVENKKYVMFNGHKYVYSSTKRDGENNVWNWYNYTNEQIGLCHAANLFSRLVGPGIVDGLGRAYYYKMTPKGDAASTRTTTNLNGHEAVDLGLPSGTKWATCNVGATRPSEPGYYFAWGETKPKTSFTDNNSLTSERNFNDISGDKRYDAATANWGSPWRLPSKTECEELITNCIWTWTNQEGMNGYRVTSKLNGNSIFISAAGFCEGLDTNKCRGTHGYYWTSTPETRYHCASSMLWFISNKLNMLWEGRSTGLPVRPVVK